MHNNKVSIIDYYKEDFNPVRDSVGLIPFDKAWQTNRFEERNAYWCNDTSKNKLIYDTINMIGVAFYAGKALLFNESDSLDNTLHKEVDVFIIKKRDAQGRLTNSQLSLIYDFKANEMLKWDYSLEQETHEIEKDFFPEGTHIVQVEHITKQESDSILRDWNIYHPSMNTK